MKNFLKILSPFGKLNRYSSEGYNPRFYHKREKARPPIAVWPWMPAVLGQMPKLRSISTCRSRPVWAATPTLRAGTKPVPVPSISATPTSIPASPRAAAGCGIPSPLTAPTVRIRPAGTCTGEATKPKELSNYYKPLKTT